MNFFSFSQGKHLIFINKLKQYQEIEFHKNLADIQRSQYNKDLNDKHLLNDSLLIELDFKEKIRIGLSPRQKNEEFYKQQYITLLGFGVYFYENNKINCYNVDIVSESLSSDAKSVVESFKLLRNMDFFRRIDKKKYVIWTDCGTHFRCAQFYNYLFNELIVENIFVKWNFFAEKHGKNRRDQHFSAVSNYLKQESFKTKIGSTDDIVNCLNKYQERSNENRKKLNLDPILYQAVNFDTEQLINNSEKRKYDQVNKLDDETEINEQLDNIILDKQNVNIKDMNIYYNLQNIIEDNRVKIKTSLTADGSNLYDLMKNNFLAKESSFRTVGESTLLDKTKANIEYLKSKRLKLEMIKNTACETQNSNIETVENSSNLNIETISDNSPNLNNWCEVQGCNSCKVDCLYTIEDLKDKRKIGQKKINQELSRHNHPKTRIIDKINKLQRTTEQGRQELIKHYENLHFFNTQ